MYAHEERLWRQGHRRIAGCDEVGRGPLAGPLVAAAVVLDPDERIDGLADSKTLSAKRRAAISDLVRKKAQVAVVTIPAHEVDKLNVLAASELAMRKAVAQLGDVDHILTDALSLKETVHPQTALIKGDSRSASIAAASIVAKVERDAYMERLGKKHPVYGFERHKGYPTKEHIRLLEEYGITDEHRKSFAPVRRILEKQMHLDLG